MSELSRYFYTIRYLKLSQIYWRLFYRLHRAKVDLRLAPELRAVTPNWQQTIKKKPTKVGDNLYCFLNKTLNISGKSIWNDTTLDKLWLYNLHYFDDIDLALVQRWLAENPPAIGVGWEPYPTSLRIVNWIKWLLSGGSATPEMLHSLAIQVRFLTKRIEWHLLGNHLLANAKALIFAGLFFAGHEAERWLGVGLEILQREIPEQILVDGGHFELSPMYHCIILEDILDLVNIARAYNQRVPSLWSQVIPKMFNWLERMVHPDGEIAFFNDTAIGIAASPAALQAYGERLNLIGSAVISPNNINCLSGYWSLQNDRAVVIIDAASVGPDYLPGHAHADTLSFELSLGGDRIVVNSGTSSYKVSQERLWQRGTAAHNTVVVDGKNSSEVWSSFRMARRARPRLLMVSDDELQAEHDGYTRLRGKPMHRRSWCLGNNSLVIGDEIYGKGEHAGCARFYFAPELTITATESSNEFIVYTGQLALLQLKFWAQHELSVTIEDSYYFPEFGIKKPNKNIVVNFSGQLPLGLQTEINWA